MSKLKRGKWYLFCDKPLNGEEPVWVGRYFEQIAEVDDGKRTYITYILDPDGAKNYYLGGNWEYCVPFPKIPKVKLK
jgi:hypothetical protein